VSDCFGRDRARLYFERFTHTYVPSTSKEGERIARR
jgi:hypothetical protein